MRPERRWRLDAHCRGEANEIFFPKLPAPRGEDPYAEARKLCAECSVTDECYELSLDFVAAGDNYGFFGGLSPAERRQRRAAEGFVPPFVVTRSSAGLIVRKRKGR